MALEPSPNPTSLDDKVPVLPPDLSSVSDQCGHMGFACFAECPRKGSHVHSLAALIYDMDEAMVTAWEPAPVVNVTRST